MSGWGAGFPGVPEHKAETIEVDDSSTDAGSPDGDSTTEQ
jgi:hypothetical protein